MEIKRPSLQGQANFEYLGHFAQDQYIQMGHNDVDENLSRNKLAQPKEGGKGEYADLNAPTADLKVRAEQFEKGSLLRGISRNGREAEQDEIGAELDRRKQQSAQTRLAKK